MFDLRKKHPVDFVALEPSNTIYLRKKLTWMVLMISSTISMTKRNPSESFSCNTMEQGPSWPGMLFSSDGTRELQVIERRQKAVFHIKILYQTSPLTEGPVSVWLQLRFSTVQCNSCGRRDKRIHPEPQSWAFFNHPACSYDSNPIEDKWGWMAHDFYRIDTSSKLLTS